VCLCLFCVCLFLSVCVRVASADFNVVSPPVRLSIWPSPSFLPYQEPEIVCRRLLFFTKLLNSPQGVSLSGIALSAGTMSRGEEDLNFDGAFMSDTQFNDEFGESDDVVQVVLYCRRCIFYLFLHKFLCFLCPEL
jgi:hypothetical protein